MAFSISVGPQFSHQNASAALTASVRSTIATLEKSQGFSVSGQTQPAQQTQPARQDSFSFSLDNNSANSTVAALASGQARRPQIEQELAANMMSANGESLSDQASPYPEAPAPTRASMMQAMQAAGGGAISQAQAPSASIMKLLG